jgi:hypothetical protein
MPWLTIILFAAAALAVIDGIIRVRGRGTPILACSRSSRVRS